LAFLAAIGGGADDQLARLVDGLGPKSNYRDLERINAFGCKAVPLLARQLVPSTDEFVLDQGRQPARASKLVWTIAALRYVTGEDFHAPKRTARIGLATEPRVQFLTRGVPEGKAKIFGFWMSRSRVYFAQPSAQRIIIAQWRAFVRSGKCKTSLKGHRDVQFWLYGGREYAG
jgi:hypothetical protein